MKKLTIIFAMIFCSATLLSSCTHQKHVAQHSSSTDNKSPNINSTQTVKGWINPLWPQGTNIKKTGSSQRYMANLNASIKDLTGLTEQTGQHKTALANKLYHRFQIIGNIRDVEVALSHLQDAIDTGQPTAETFRIRATILASLHRFDEALIDLDNAENQGAEKTGINTMRNNLHIAKGHYTPLLENDIQQDEHLLMAKYALLNDDFITASRHYQLAEWTYQGDNPFHLAWLQLQQGIAFLRYGEIEAAHHFFATAHQRFPAYYLVAEHLAETELLMNNLAKAHALYTQVSEQTNNPVFYAQLAKVQERLGENDKSHRSLSTAHQLFEQLMISHPLTVSDHAVEFYSEQGQHSKAMTLAKSNLVNRQNIESWLLMAAIAFDANQLQEGCFALQQSKALGFRPIELIELSAETTQKCSVK